MNREQMKPEEAIEILEKWSGGGYATQIDDMNPAVKLGIEALKCLSLLNSEELREKIDKILGELRCRIEDEHYDYHYDARIEARNQIISLIQEEK